jgi:hypothetical protein
VGNQPEGGGPEEHAETGEVVRRRPLVFRVGSPRA